MSDIVKYDMSTMDLGKTLAASGYFQDAKSISQAVVKVLAGRELGLPPVASMSGINIIQGRPALSANVMAALVKRSGRYDYRVKSMTEKECSIEFFERADGKRESIGVSTFTLDEARKAGTKNLDKFPRNMLFARAMSNGFRWFTPDLCGGPVYTPEEMGAEVDEEGQVVSLPAEPARPTLQDAPGDTIDAEPIPEYQTESNAADYTPPPAPPAPASPDPAVERLISSITDLGLALCKEPDVIEKAIATAKTAGFGKNAPGKDSLEALRRKWHKEHNSMVTAPTAHEQERLLA